MQASAIVRSLEVLGEAAGHHPEIEWQVIIGMRNRLIHAYFNIDEAVVWQTVHENLPPFILKLKSLIEMFEF